MPLEKVRCAHPTHKPRTSKTFNRHRPNPDPVGLRVSASKQSPGHRTSMMTRVDWLTKTHKPALLGRSGHSCGRHCGSITVRTLRKGLPQVPHAQRVRCLSPLPPIAGESWLLWSYMSAMLSLSWNASPSFGSKKWVVSPVDYLASFDQLQICAHCCCRSRCLRILQKLKDMLAATTTLTTSPAHS